MAIVSIKPTNFRNLAHQTIQLHPRLNVVYGDNASGKTSFLEAIYYLTSARSFRTRKFSAIKSYSAVKEPLVLFGNFSELNKTTESNVINRLGVSRMGEGDVEIKLNSEPIRSAARLAKTFPSIVIEPRSFEFLLGGPKFRRKFLDWGVFHVEHYFSDAWKAYTHCLKQRNSLLRSGRIDGKLLSIWDGKLAHYAELIDQMRARYVLVFTEYFEELVKKFSIESGLVLSYSKGWDKNLSYHDALKKNSSMDQAKGMTHQGAHRADIKITKSGVDAAEQLSRGQQKLLIVALYLAHVETLYSEFNISTMVLLDDLTAELDSTNVIRVLNYLKGLDSQVICSSLEFDEKLYEAISSDHGLKVFHVEQGNLMLEYFRD